MSLLPNNKDKLKTFEELAIPHLNFIYRSAYRLCGKRSDADDLSQETFRLAFENFDQLREHNKIKSWLFIILRNVYLKQIKRKKTYVDINIYLASYNLQDFKSIGKEYFDKILNGEVQTALNKLPEKYKTPLILTYIAGYSYKEIADMLHLPIGTVMSRISRGKVFIKKEIIDAVKPKVVRNKCGSQQPAETASVTSSTLVRNKAA